MRKFYSACLAMLFICLTGMASNPFQSGSRLKLKEGDYVKGSAIIKMKPAARMLCRASSIDVGSMNEKLAMLGATVEKRFPHAQPVINERNRYNVPMVDISLIYTVKFNESTPVQDALAVLAADPAVAYAEPEYISHTDYNPNDPNTGSQSFLTKIQAYSAWDSWKGDTNTVIGIIDSGTDPSHPDLAANIKHNYADPIDGIDNDGDGFTDNYTGWDISDNDNNTTVGGSVHGSHVSGCADAVTDNGVGVASPGFKCKFLPVKVAKNTSTTSIDNGYDGVVYAADHGCNVINMSWGRSGGPSQFEQDIINYAAVNHDITAVAAAGNDGLEEGYFPAAYDNVVSVAAVLANDVKASFSNFGYTIDVCAPGNNIYSTVYPSSYTTMSGTSMASPIAAGCAAMIKSKFPTMNHEQVAEQLRNTSDNVYQLSGNSSYPNMLGKGRVNLFKAVTDSVSPGVTAQVVSMTDGNDNVFVGNDTISVVVLFKNLLHPTTNLTTVLSTTSTYAHILDSTFTGGVLNTFDTISNYALTYRFVVDPLAPLNLSAPFKVTMTDGVWSDFLPFYIKMNVDYINIEVNNIGTSQTSKGRIGYNTTGPGEGLGFKYKGSPSNLYEMGLMIGDGTHQVSDCVRNDLTVNGGYDEDFALVNRVAQSAGPQSDFFCTGLFDENGPTSNGLRMNIQVRHNTYAWVAAADRNYVIVEYVIHNMGTSALTNLHAGIFADFDVLNVAGTSTYADDRDSVDVGRKMGYAYNTSSDGYFCGTKVLSHSAPFNHYALDNDTVNGGGGGGIVLADGFTEAEKFTALSTDRASAGRATASPTGNDVCDVTSTGPLTINAGDTAVVAFALLSGENLDTLQSGADAAQIRYDGLHTGIQELSVSSQMLLNIYPNPANKSANVTFQILSPSQVDVDVYNITGEKVKSLLSKKLNSGIYILQNELSDLQEGNYFIRLHASGKTEIQKLIIVK